MTGDYPDNGGTSAGQKQTIIRYGTGTNVNCNLCIYNEYTASGIYNIVVNIRGLNTTVLTGVTRLKRIIQFTWDGFTAKIHVEGNLYTVPIGSNSEITGLSITCYNNYKGEFSEINGWDKSFSQSELAVIRSMRNFTYGVVL
ncbi:hypothetical protein [Flavobacterium sp. UMI-01]|uniref:hypothetical protein n=1 Tax=Flavobacterium sp. UMI-01 TaxID=1441053 RepID=UPI001C7D74F4|nr:hypothetical protein [Flavobacterium sp. UMI-01]